MMVFPNCKDRINSQGIAFTYELTLDRELKQSKDTVLK